MTPRKTTKTGKTGKAGATALGRATKNRPDPMEAARGHLAAISAAWHACPLLAGAHDELAAVLGDDFSLVRLEKPTPFDVLKAAKGGRQTALELMQLLYADSFPQAVMTMDAGRVRALSRAVAVLAGMIHQKGRPARDAGELSETLLAVVRRKMPRNVSSVPLVLHALACAHDGIRLQLPEDVLTAILEPGFTEPNLLVSVAVAAHEFGDGAFAMPCFLKALGTGRLELGAWAVSVVHMIRIDDDVDACAAVADLLTAAAMCREPSGQAVGRACVGLVLEMAPRCTPAALRLLVDGLAGPRQKLLRGMLDGAGRERLAAGRMTAAEVDAMVGRGLAALDA